MKEIFKKLYNAVTEKEVLEIIDELNRKKLISWKYVGGKQNNLTDITVGKDPAVGLIERVTNGMDAVIELAYIRARKPDNIKSARQAAEVFFGIKDGRLSSISNARDKKIQELAKMVYVGFRESGDPNRPTAEVRDNGVGLSSKEIPDTIMSLRSSNKTTKFHQMGCYGHGGSTAMAFNNYTIIMTKRAIPDTKGNPLVSFTIARVVDGDYDLDKMGWYEYCVDSSTGNPISVEIPNAEFEHGTLVRHIAMDLGKYAAGASLTHDSLTMLLNHNLFDPIIPFRAGGDRKIDKYKSKDGKARKNNSRPFFGSTRKLSIADDDDYKSIKKNTVYEKKYYATLSKDEKDEIVITAFVFREDYKEMRYYIKHTHPIIAVFNGQKHGEMPASVISTDMELPFLSKHLIVQIDCDKINSKSRRDLFTPVRDGFKGTSLYDELEQLVVDVIKSDPELKRINVERKNSIIKQDFSDDNKELKEKLAAMINKTSKSKNGACKVIVNPKDNDENLEDRPSEIMVSNPPTFIEITSQDKNVQIGKRFSVNFKTDADPKLFQDPNSFMAFLDNSSFGRFSCISSISRGYGTILFEVNDNIEPNITANVTLELRPKRQCALNDSIKVTSINPIIKKPNNKGLDLGLVVRWFGKKDKYYIDEKWTPQTVVESQIIGNNVCIFLNQNNVHYESNIVKKFSSLRNKCKDKSIKALQNKYGLHIGVVSAAMRLGIINNEFKKEGISIEECDLEKVQQKDMSYFCETISEMIGDELYESIVTRSEAKKDN